MRMVWFRQRAMWLLAGIGLSQALCACGSERVVGEQCPGPYSGNATLQGSLESIDTVVGTSCAPCSSAPPKLDKRGCPTFVTFESCGGDVCLGGRRIERPSDAGAGAADGGNESDAGSAPTEDTDAG